MFKKILLALFVLVFSTIFSLNIQFLSQATVTHNVVTVFDLAATFNGIDEKSLKNLNLVYLPDNSSYDLDIRYVLLELSKIATDIVATPTNGTIWISNVKSHDTSTLTVDLAKEIAFESVLSNLPPQSEATILSIEGTITNHDNFSVEIINTENDTYVVKFNLFENGLITGFYKLDIFVSHLRKAYVANRDIYFGEFVVPEYLTETYINDLDIFGTNFELSDLPMIAKKNIKVGEPVFKEYLQTVPYSVKFQIIEGYVVINGVIVKAKFRLLEDGKIGDAVKAENIETGKIVIGIIEEGPKLFILKWGE